MQLRQKSHSPLGTRGSASEPAAVGFKRKQHSSERMDGWMEERKQAPTPKKPERAEGWRVGGDG
jgi:hypothetical protein